MCYGRTSRPVARLAQLRRGIIDSPLWRVKKYSPVLQDNEKMRVLEMHHEFQSNAQANCLVCSIVLLVDEEKLDKMACLELNQFYNGAEYKVCNNAICIWFDKYTF